MPRARKDDPMIVRLALTTPRGLTRLRRAVGSLAYMQRRKGSRGRK